MDLSKRVYYLMIFIMKKELINDLKIYERKHKRYNCRRNETNSNVFLLSNKSRASSIYKVSQGLLEEFSSKGIVDTPITEAGLQVSCRSCNEWFKASCRIYDMEFCYASYRSYY